MSSLKQILFGERAAGVYLKTEIYDPDIDGSDITHSGKIVPAIGSLVVDNTVGLHNQQYTVVAVDQTTYKATLIPSTFVVDSTAQTDRVLSYGNDLFFLYFNTVKLSVSGDLINITRLIVDNKLSLFGNHAAQYQLFRTKSDGTEEVISRWHVNNKYVGTVCDMLETGVKGIRKCDGCYTDINDLREGDIVTLKVYSAGGLMIAAIQLIAKEAYLLNEAAANANPIVGMYIDANQIDRDGKLYLYQNQNTEELAIFVMLKYSDGSIKRVAIDNLRGFCYGLEQVDTSVVGNESDVVVKYYLSQEDALGESMTALASRFIIEKYQQLTNNPDVTIDTEINDDPALDYHTKMVEFINLTFGITVTGDLSTVGDYVSFVVNYITSHEESSVANDEEIRYLSEFVTIKIISSEQELLSKISPIPMWNRNTASWSLKFIKYRIDRTSSVAGNVEILQENGVDTFIGNKFGEQQTVRVTASQMVNGIETSFTQSFVIELRNKNDATSAENGLNWLIQDDSASLFAYGDNTGNHVRPVIYYTTANGYHIPASVFSANSNQSAVEVFIENFYTQANPPKLITETIAPTPTHFIVKDPSTNRSLMTEMRAIEDFTSPLRLNVDTATSNSYVNDTLLVEFYRYDEDTDTTDVLYGVPVDVVQGH